MSWELGNTDLSANMGKKKVNVKSVVGFVFASMENLSKHVKHVMTHLFVNMHN